MLARSTEAEPVQVVRSPCQMTSMPTVAKPAPARVSAIATIARRLLVRPWPKMTSGHPFAGSVPEGMVKMYAAFCVDQLFGGRITPPGPVAANGSVSEPRYRFAARWLTGSPAGIAAAIGIG